MYFFSSCDKKILNYNINFNYIIDIVSYFTQKHTNMVMTVQMVNSIMKCVDQMVSPTDVMVTLIHSVNWNQRFTSVMDGVIALFGPERKWNYSFTNTNIIKPRPVMIIMNITEWLRRGENCIFPQYAHNTKTRMFHLM